jgi:hypothetical protein
MKTRITIEAHGDTLDGLWAREDGENADRLARERFEDYLNRALALVADRWPGAEVVVRDDTSISGATPPSRVESYSEDYGWVPDEREDYILERLLDSAYTQACEP